MVSTIVYEVKAGIKNANKITRKEAETAKNTDIKHHQKLRKEGKISAKSVSKLHVNTLVDHE